MSFQQGLSGLNASSKNLSVIGNNIANANTFGSKTARAEFSDVYAAALGGTGAANVGIGTNLVTVAQQFSQGNITTTENSMDLAISGGGFFQMTDGINPTLYSRNGQFKIDRDGYIVNNSRLRLMGYPADAAGVVQPGAAVGLQLPNAGVVPKATDTISLRMNLDSRLKPTGLAAAPGINFTDATTYNNATSLTTFDVRGQEVAMTLYFQKTDTPGATPNDNTWNVFATANGATVGGDPPQPITTLSYPANGSAPVAPVGTFTVTQIVAGNNSQGGLIVPLDNVTFDMTKTTQFGSPFGVTELLQNGYAAGQLTGIGFETNGNVMARYSNGRSQPVGRVDLANFRNPQGLQAIGDNAWRATVASNDAVRGVPGDGNMGALQASALEESNIDLTGELVGMITAQRIYQANAQTIKAQDQILQTLVNLR